MSRTDEANTNQANMVPRREQNGLNIQELESDITASGKVTAEDLELAVLKRAESDKNGVVPAREAMAIFRDDAKSHLDLKKSRRMVALLFLLLLLLLLSMTGLVALVTAMSKDAYVKGDTSTRPTMSNADDQVVGVRAATHNLPLLVSPVLPDDELFSVETIRVTLPGSTEDSAGPAEGGSSGEAINETTINEVTPGVVNAFRISRVEKVNSTAVVFHALGGEQIRVWNGETTVRLAAIGPEIPVCSANVTCAAFQVKGAALAEKYLAEAEALLAPFAEGRRRLADKCVDPFGWIERDVAQKQLACTNPTTEQGCRALARQMGLMWEDSGISKTAQHSVGPWITSGCFTYKEGVQVDIKRNRDEFTHVTTSTHTVDLHKQAFFGTGGTDAQMNTDLGSGDEIRLPMLDPACLALSNQAKLDAKLDRIIGHQFTWIQNALNWNQNHIAWNQNALARLTG